MSFGAFGVCVYLASYAYWVWVIHGRRREP